MRVGIHGGTFNPPHVGHLICAQEALIELALERVLLIPARIPPHKRVEEEPGAEHRLELCMAAIGADRRFAVSTLELDRPGPSFTVDTLVELKSAEPDNELFLIVGGDIAVGFTSWREPERVLSLAQLAVAKRRGTARHAIETAVAGLQGRERVEFFRMPRIGVSSTMIRRRVAQHQPIRYLVADAVADYIEANGLYRHGGHEH